MQNKKLSGVYATKAAAYLGISRDMLDFYIRQRGAPEATHRHGRKRVFTTEDLKDFSDWLQEYHKGKTKKISHGE